MLKIIQKALSEIRATRREIQHTEGHSKHMEERSRAFIQDRKAHSDVYNRIEAMREAIPREKGRPRQASRPGGITPYYP